MSDEITEDEITEHGDFNPIDLMTMRGNYDLRNDEEIEEDEEL